MSIVKLNGGFKFNLQGFPSEQIEDKLSPSLLGISAAGFYGVKPRIVVKIGDKVIRGQELFHDKENEQVKFVSPVSGIVKTIEYGHRRLLKGVVIEPDLKDQQFVDFGKYSNQDIEQLSNKAIVDKLLKSGLWQQIKSSSLKYIKPSSDFYDKLIADFYVSTLSTEPHGPSAATVLDGNEKYYQCGLKVLQKLSKKLYVITSPKKSLPPALFGNNGVDYREFEDKYPSCNGGVQKWHINPSNKDGISAGADLDLVIAIGYLFHTGKVKNTRIYSLYGDVARKHINSYIGTLASYVADADFDSSEYRIIAGGLITGRKIDKSDFLGLADKSVGVVIEDKKRTPFVFLRPGLKNLSFSRAWASSFLPPGKFDISTSSNGEERACIQCGACIDVCPVDLVPNLIMKSSLVDDMEQMESLSIDGCVDCGLCTFVCPAKIEVADHIKRGKIFIEKEG